jgi:hypothetical protein
MPQLARLLPAEEPQSTGAPLWQGDPALLTALQALVDDAAAVAMGSRLMLSSARETLDQLTSGRFGSASWHVPALRVLELGEPIGQPGLAVAPILLAHHCHGAFLLHYDYGYVASQHEYMALAHAYAAQASALLREAAYHASAIWQSAQAMVDMLAVYEPATAGHSGMVRRLVHNLGTALNLEGRELLRLEVGALLHDVGKIGVPADLLTRDSCLEAADWALMRGHPSTGERLVRGVDLLAAVAPAVRHHHERWDGAGYPDRLSGDSIPFHARLISLADAYEAMRAGRPYREARTPDETVAELGQCMGSQFDPSLGDLLPVLKGCDLLDWRLPRHRVG